MLESVQTQTTEAANAPALAPGEMRAHLVFSLGVFIGSQLNETKEQEQCSSLSDSSNG